MDFVTWMITETPILAYIPYALAGAAVLVGYRILSAKRDYTNKVVEIKEAPVGVNNLMKDSIKRSVLRALRSEKKYMSMISREIGESAPRLRYHLKQLEKVRLLKSYKLARESYFSLTKEGQWCLNAINYYYPTTNFKFVTSRMKKAMGVTKMRRLSRNNKGEGEQGGFGINSIFHGQ